MSSTYRVKQSVIRFVYRKLTYSRIVFCLISCTILISVHKIYNIDHNFLLNVGTDSNTFVNGAFVDGIYRSTIKEEDIPRASRVRLSKDKSELYNTDDINDDYNTFLRKMHKLSSQELCSHLVSKINDDTISWSHRNIDSDTELTQMAERIRLYNYCFLQERLSLTESLGAGQDQAKFLNQMFPYLKADNHGANLITKYNLLNNEKIEYVFSNSNEEPWSTWMANSNGRGIVTTLSITDMDYFARFIRVLAETNNTLPVQIILAEKDSVRQMFDLVLHEATKQKQAVEIIDCSDVLDFNFMNSSVSGYLNKWIATLFNNFEEFVFIDVDAIPFIPVQDFFEIKGFRQRGIHMYRDRAINHEHLSETCISSFYQTEPSYEEGLLLNVKAVFGLDTHILEGEQTSVESTIYSNFFHDLNHHQVDSGLVVIKKVPEVFGGLLLSFQLNLARIISHCVHGDKEFFWIGQLMAGNSYSIDPIGPGALGGIYEIDADNIKNGVQFGVCSTQIGHYSFSKGLLWVNGGLKICKNPIAAENDFLEYYDFMSERYGSINRLRDIYDKPLYIDGIIIPDVQRGSWIQTRECSKYRFCASVEVSIDYKNEVNSQVVHFTEIQKHKYNYLAGVWSENFTH